MALASGTRIGAYEVLSPLGAGGMGEVYRALDTRLGRHVAIKTLPETLDGDPQRIARLQREAQLLATLNHPHIAGIFGLETVGSAHFLILELVEGESLAALISRGRLPVDQALAIARQIVDALEAAHDKGIIHRDLKPANVMLTHDGQVKVLDFGLARAIEGEPGSSVTNSPTLSFAATQAGVILGTAAYMSPEQAKGRVADRRSDVWAFGCVFFEMVTGQRAFDGEDVSDILAGILRGEPDWNAFPPEVPQSIRALIRRCIEKDRRARIPDMSVVRFFMSEAAAPQTAPTVPPRTPLPRRSVAVIGLVGAATAVILMAGATYAWRVWNPPPAAEQVRFAIVPPQGQPLMVTSTDRTIAISPNGKYVVYMGAVAGQSRLLVRPLNQLEGTALTGTDAARQPFFSPDSRWIGFFSGTELKKISITGGAPVTLCRFTGGAPRGASWADNNSIVFATGGQGEGLFVIPAGGGEPKLVSKPSPDKGERDHILPFVLPGARAALVTIPGGNLDASQIAAVDLNTGAVTPLIAGGTQAEYADGFIVYGSSGGLRAVRFDPDRLKVSTDPIPVLDGVAVGTGTGTTYFALTKNGSLLFVPGSAAHSARRLVWMNRRGQEDPIPAPSRTYTNPRLSPDDTRLALDIRDQDEDIWIWNFARQTLERLTTEVAQDQNAVWTKDGRRIAFNSTRGGGPPNLYAQAADGTGPVERWTISENLQVPFWISADTMTVVFMEIFPTTGPDVMLLHRETKPRVEPLVRTNFSEVAPDVSPDGRWIVYQSAEGGAPQIYVRPFPNADGGRWQISASGGTRPVWGRNGKELFFLDPSRGLVSVPVQLTGTFTAGQPTKLFDSGAYVGLPGRPYDVTRDGQRFVVVKEADSGDRSTLPASMVMVLNWIEELKARVPTAR